MTIQLVILSETKWSRRIS